VFLADWSSSVAQAWRPPSSAPLNHPLLEFVKDSLNYKKDDFHEIMGFLTDTRWGDTITPLLDDALKGLFHALPRTTNV